MNFPLQRKSVIGVKLLKIVSVGKKEARGIWFRDVLQGDFFFWGGANFRVISDVGIYAAWHIFKSSLDIIWTTGLPAVLLDMAPFNMTIE